MGTADALARRKSVFTRLFSRPRLNGKVGTRRSFLQTGTGLLAGTSAVSACGPRAESYASAVAETWRRFDPSLATTDARMREIVRYATLAPSSHNTQCWTFVVRRNAIDVVPDFTRRCSAVDPDDHHLFVSLGCATENLVQAARAYGLHGAARYAAAGGGGVEVTFEAVPARESALFAAIVERQCTRGQYDGSPVPSSDLAMLEKAGSGPGVRVDIRTARREMERIVSFVVDANTIQMRDGAFMSELQRWVRFNDAEAVARRDGLFSRASGSPALPSWLGNALFRSVMTPSGENDKYARFIRSSAGVAPAR